MGNFNFIETPLNDLFILERKVFRDDRGIFFRMFCQEELKEIALNETISQINYSYAKERFTTRGFHFQYPPDSEIKIVTCVKGEIFDVVVDLRPSSNTFLKSFSIILTEENFKSLFIPKGFGHAQQAIVDDSTLLYFHTRPYNKSNEGGVNVNDPAFGKIDWPGPILNQSERDKNFPFIDENFKGIQ